MSSETASERERELLLVHALVDGELDPANAIAMEQRIAADPMLANERARVETLRRALRERLPREVPPGLPDQIRRTVGLAHARNQTRPSWRAMAASIALAIVASSGGTWFVLQPSTRDVASEAVIASHLRALMAPQPIDVVSSDRHTVKPWFNGRIPQAPRVVDLTQDGFPLVGGRIDVIGHSAVPTLVYRHRQHLISLTAVAGAAREMAPPTPRAVQGYNLIGWAADGIAYWAVSDLGTGDLEKFARLFREAAPER